jgi:hypothetical protein
VPSCSAHVSHALIPGDTQPGALVVSELLARRGHQRCHCNQGFGTSSRSSEMTKATAVPVRV